ncbi:hypothetical protein AVEN_155193-1 [Araneus ventricosus]|uniref:Uncharacterized protein n=1 Tax=Araneus ventricosus TaxID=182803 RepID=A0A4Y2VK73_ARAVE|nr:hypothetical protein AVEN_155193-1 [Araneus ventricosus]
MSSCGRIAGSPHMKLVLNATTKDSASHNPQKAWLAEVCAHGPKRLSESQKTARWVLPDPAISTLKHTPFPTRWDQCINVSGDVYLLFHMNCN